MNQVINQQTSN